MSQPMNENFKKGDIVLAPLSYSDLVNNKLRPSLVLYHDTDVMQLTVAYISSKVPAKPGQFDIVIPLGTATSTTAGLLYSSVVKVYWTAMIKRILVNRKIGEADNDLREKVNRILPSALAI